MNEQIEKLKQLQNQNILAQKRGIHFLLTAVLILSAILGIRMTSLSLERMNLLTFCAAAPMMPIALGFSRVFHIDFQNKENPLSMLGLVFTLNQLLYLLIPMWAMFAAPRHMLMLYLIIFGAHLLPYGWLYQSRSYTVFSLLITFTAFFLGLAGNQILMAAAVVLLQILFCLSVLRENRNQGQ